MNSLRNEFIKEGKKDHDYRDHYHNLRHRILGQKKLEVIVPQLLRLIALAEAYNNTYKDASLIEKVYTFAQTILIQKKENLIANDLEYKKLKEEESEIDFRKMWSKDFVAIDGHEVRSLSEAYIDNWFFYNKINHIYEKQIILKDSTLISDFYLPEYDLYVEYWGKYDKKYISRKQAKIKIYEENHIKYLGIGLNDIKNIDFYLTKTIKKS